MDTLGEYGTDAEGNEIWTAAEGSPFRSLTHTEIADARATAERTRPVFGGEHNATWDQHHPVMRAVWERVGHRPAEG